MQIIQEEIAHINEVEVIRRGRKGKELELWDQWKKLWKELKDSEDREDKAKADKAFTELYKSIKPKIMKFLSRNNIKTTDDASIEDIAQGAFEKIIKDPDIFKGGSALSTYLNKIAFNKAMDEYVRIIKHGGSTTTKGDITAVSDMAQMAGETFEKADVMGGSRFPNQESRATVLNALKKLWNSSDKDRAAVEAFVLSDLMGYTGEEIAKMPHTSQKSQPAVSRDKEKAIEKLRKILSPEDLKALQDLDLEDLKALQDLQEAALPTNEIQKEELSLEKIIAEVLSELV